MKKHLHNSLRALFLSLAVLLSLPMLAEQVEIDGINYDLNAETTQAAVIKKSSGGYYGDVVIPESVEHERTTYSVTSIGDEAFLACSGLTSVTIGNSVTSIGYQAFSCCSGLISVTIGNSVESIGGAAFYDCSGLTSVTIPNSVTSIEYQAFCYCSGLTSVTIPNSVTSIGINAFALCSELTSVTIGNGVESIGQLAFDGCSKLHDVYCYAEEVPTTESNAFESSTIASATLHVPAGSVDSYNETVPWKDFGTIDAIPPFSGEVEIDGINYELNGETKQATVIAKTSGEYSGSIVIPESVEYNGTTYSVTSIGNNAFYSCYGLTSVTIGNSVTSIGDKAFYSCSGLTSVTIGNSVTSIGDRVFWGCSGLASATIGNSVASIGNMAFYYCSSLTSVTIGNGVESIGRLAFRECSKLSDVYCYAEIVPSTESNAFGDSPIGTATLYVPAGSVDSYKNAEPWSVFGTIDAIPPFFGEVEIDGINYELNGETKQATVIAKSSDKYSGEVIIPESVEYDVTTYSVTSIGTSAFVYCDGLTSVTIPNSVTSIGRSAFYDCDGLTSVTIPNSVVSIADQAFANCKGLTSVTIPNSVTSIGGSAFYGCKGLTSVTIPNSVTSIGGSAFYGCKGLTSVTIGSSVESIGWSTFGNCSILSDVYCYAEEVPITSSDAFVYLPASATLHVPAGSVESYKETAPWSDFKNIVALPPFSGEVEINGINYDLNAETKQAAVIAKSSDKYSGSIVIPESVEHERTTYSVTSIGDEAFLACSGLTSVTIPNNVTSIGDRAFRDCSGLTSVTIPNSVASIGNYAFEGCSGLTSVHISDIIAWCNIEFGDCYSNPLYYAHHLHLNGEEAKDLVIPNSVTSIGDYAFWGCSGLTSVTIPNSVTSIGGGGLSVIALVWPRRLSVIVWRA